MSNGPFAVGQRYRVLKDFKALRDAFLAGEVLIYESTAWSDDYIPNPFTFE